MIEDEMRDQFEMKDPGKTSGAQRAELTDTNRLQGHEI
jgi:hypothetical protein